MRDLFLQKYTRFILNGEFSLLRDLPHPYITSYFDLNLNHF